MEAQQSMVLLANKDREIAKLLREVAALQHQRDDALRAHREVETKLLARSADAANLASVSYAEEVRSLRAEVLQLQDEKIKLQRQLKTSIVSRENFDVLSAERNQLEFELHELKLASLKLQAADEANRTCREDLIATRRRLSEAQLEVSELKGKLKGFEERQAFAVATEGNTLMSYNAARRRCGELEDALKLTRMSEAAAKSQAANQVEALMDMVRELELRHEELCTGEEMEGELLMLRTMTDFRFLSEERSRVLAGLRILNLPPVLCEAGHRDLAAGVDSLVQLLERPIDGAQGFHLVSDSSLR
jgi:hypothetical protein